MDEYARFLRKIHTAERSREAAWWRARHSRDPSGTRFLWRMSKRIAEKLHDQYWNALLGFPENARSSERGGYST